MVWNHYACRLLEHTAANMAAAEQDNTALVVFTFYMLGMTAIAARGFFANRAANKANALNTGDTAHFLGQQDFGVVVIFPIFSD